MKASAVAGPREASGGHSHDRTAQSHLPLFTGRERVLARVHVIMGNMKVHAHISTQPEAAG